MTYYHVPAPMLKELRCLLERLEDLTVSDTNMTNTHQRAVTARLALGGVNAFEPMDSDNA